MQRETPPFDRRGTKRFVNIVKVQDSFGFKTSIRLQYKKQGGARMPGCGLSICNFGINNF